MFTWIYALGELTRRRGRAIATALGLAVGVGLVAAVGALSNGLSDAQDEVLAPLESLGTDISVGRPLQIDAEGGDGTRRGAFAALSEEEREQLRAENEGARLDFGELGEPGEEFVTDQFASFGELSFDESEVTAVAAVDGVADVAPSLTLNWIHIEGTVPEASEQAQGGPGGGPGAAGPRIGGGAGFQPRTIAGIDVSAPDLALVTPDQITEGEYLADGAAAKAQAVVGEAYAGSEDVVVGDELTIDGQDFSVVGIASAPLGGESADVYVDLGKLQAMSGREGRVNDLRVSAEEGSDVDAVAAAIEEAFPGSTATTASDLADSVQGSLTNAKDLVGSLGTILAIVALLAAVALASLLMLGAVARRTREFGTLKAIGWPGSRLVRQVVAESAIIGVIGGLAGVVVGLLASVVVGSLGITLEASAEPAGGGVFGAGGPPGAPGGAEAAAETTDVTLSAPLDPALVGIAVLLAIAGALVAGAVAAARIARLRPAAALRAVE